MRRLVATAGLALVLTAGWLQTQAGHGAVPSPPLRAPALNRIALIVLENRSFEQVIGNRSAPYLNSLARRGALATQYYAITHPSLPNYLALTVGGHKKVNHDCSTCRSGGRSLANQLEAAGISWRAYFEDIRRPLWTRLVVGAAYNPHYNPFAYTNAVRGGDPAADVTNFASLRHDLAQRTLPRFAWIAPNVWHDGHNGSLAAVDRVARNLVPKVVRALGPRGVLFITWDEGRDADTRGAHGRGGGHVPLIAIGPAARPRGRVDVRANHYALLRTIESAFRLSALGHARNAQTPVLRGLLRSTQRPTTGAAASSRARAAVSTAARVSSRSTARRRSPAAAG
jgi:phosphatidylinositol-3-phosphatase